MQTTIRPTLARRIGRHRIAPALNFSALDSRTAALAVSRSANWLLRSQEIEALEETGETLTHRVKWLSLVGSEFRVTTLQTNGLWIEITEQSARPDGAAQAWLGRLTGAQTEEEAQALTRMGLNVPLGKTRPGIWRTLIYRPHAIRALPLQRAVSPERPLGHTEDGENLRQILMRIPG